jgi:hypothetical protein
VIDARRRARRDLRRDEFERSMNELRDNMEKLGRDAADLVNREIESLRDRLRGLRGD